MGGSIGGDIEGGFRVMGEIQNPWYSRSLDVHRWSDHPEVKGLTEKVWAEAGLDGLVKGPGPKPKQPYREQLKVILLDLYVAWLEDPELSIGVAMGVSAWNVGSRYNALHISKKILDLIPELEASGLIDLSRGSYSGPGAKGNRTTRIRASAKLQQWFTDARLERRHIVRAHDEEIIILKDTDDHENARPIEYVDTTLTNQMRADLRSYNDLIASSFIDMRTLQEPVLRISDSNGAIRSIILDADACRTRRIFSRGSWDLNGRFYGGWWQRIGSELRRNIMINNEPTIEVDFQGLHIAMLYAKEGRDMVHDPYQIDVDSFSAYPPPLVRKLVKSLTLKAINAKDKRSAYQAFRGSYSDTNAGSNLTNDELDCLMGAFVGRNPCVERYLFDDQGIRLMRLDADITARIHNHFTQKGIPVLSVHDSYIVAVDHVDELRQVMVEASEAVVGRPLRCGVDVPGYGEFDDVPEVEMKNFIGRLTWDVYRGEATACRGYVERMLSYERKANRVMSGVDECD